MGNPTRGRVEIELDKELVDSAERAGLDLNEMADRALQRALGSEQLKTVPRYAKRFERSQEEIREGVAWYNAHIERDGIFSGAHMPDEEPSDEKARRWEEENAEAIRVSNEELKRNGLWSDRYRLF